MFLSGRVLPSPATSVTDVKPPTTYAVSSMTSMSQISPSLILGMSASAASDTMPSWSVVGCAALSVGAGTRPGTTWWLMEWVALPSETVRVTVCAPIDV